MNLFAWELDLMLEDSAKFVQGNVCCDDLVLCEDEPNDIGHTGDTFMSKAGWASATTAAEQQF
jgi:hypothetical protein